jgi:two-component system, sensor histidine kinase and response regulator
MQHDQAASILVVDDEYPICTSISEMLELFGHKSDYAVSADETLMYLQKNPQTDIVLLDIDLGAGLSGEDLLPVIREKFKYVQVIIFTSQNSLEMGVECIKKGAFDYMTKPFREKKFLKKIPLALERKKIAQLNDLYMGILVHDLNNPIQYILGALELLKSSTWGIFNEKQKDIFMTAEKGVTQIRNMVNNILTISKFENGLMALKNETFSIAKELGGILKLFENEVKQSGRELSVQYPSQDLITTDKELFSRVFLNIVSNAVRYTPLEGKIFIILLEKPDDFLQVSVTNTGSFIEEDMREVIFDKFASVHLERKATGVQNFGLGLTFSKMAVKILGGAIWVESDGVEPRTTFHFTIKNRKET